MGKRTDTKGEDTRMRREETQKELNLAKTKRWTTESTKLSVNIVNFFR